MIALAAAPVLQAQRPVFQSTTSVVTVSVSVKRGNNAVAKLTAGDFALTDNGVAQTVDAVSIESVPIDVTLFLDTSGSTAGKLDETPTWKRSFRSCAGDRFRLLTISDWFTPPCLGSAGGISVSTAVPGRRPAPGSTRASLSAYPPIATRMLGLPPELGRRHPSSA
jgi:hypothetical protein